MQISKLQEIGLSKKESEIYLALIKFGSLSANEIAKRTETLRSSIYDYLETLLEKGFITYTYKSNIKSFQATNPEKLLDNFKEKKENEEKTLIELVNDLKNINKTTMKSNIEIFEGKIGLKTAIFNILKEDIKEILAFGASGTLYSLFPLTIEKWNIERGKKKIKLKIIYNDTLGDEDLEKRKKYSYIEIKHNPTKDLSYSNTFIYKNKVLLVIIDNENPFAILINNPKIYETYKTNFNMAWSQAKEYK